MKTRSGKPVHLIGYEELLSVPTIAGASDIPLEQLHEFKNHPFHVVEDEAMMELVESWIFLCGNTASPADGEPSVRTSGNRSCEFTRVMFCLSHIPHASKCHVQHQCL